jgi:signal-transduction protein with cAMP-binding, CBS, and nucleotidyltransferase domain
MTKIGPFMSTPVLTTSPDTLASEAMAKMLENKISALLIKKNEEWVGIFTKSDWMRKVVKGDGNVSSEKVDSVMTKKIVTVERSESLAKATLLMEEHRIRHLAVTDKGEIIGILSVKDLEKYYRQLHDRE